MTSQTERELISQLNGQLQECAGWDGDTISADRERALDYYYQRLRGDEVRGRSNVVAGDVSAMVEANLAQMTDAFTNANVAEFDATGPSDDDQAELESAAVIASVMKDNPGYSNLATAIKDALLVRNGWIKNWVEETELVETLTLANVTVDIIAEMRAMPGVTVEVLSWDEDEREAELRVTKTIKRFRSESVDAANMLYPRQYHSCELQDIPFIAERHIESRSDMIKRGFPKAKVMRLKAWDQDTKVDTLARDVMREAGFHKGLDRATELVEWFEIYALVDSGDGTAERRRMALAGVSQNSLLENEPVGIVPYATGSAFVNPHRLTGISIFDKLRQTQDLNTGLQRALLDNVNSAVKNRTAYLDGKVNTDDLADGRPNGDIRVRASVGDVSRAIMNFNQPDISGGILSNLEYQRQIRTELGGASLELATGQMQMAGGRIGSQGVDRAFSVMEQLAAHMTKNIAESLIRNVFLLAHATMRENFDTPVNVKVNGRWESPVPSEWRPRTRVTVKIGMSPGERARKVATLQQIVQAQIDLANLGMDNVLVNIDGFYRALTDWGRAAEVQNPEQYFIDPSTEASQKALQAKEQAEAQAAQANRALMSQAVGLEQLRSGLEKYKHDSELQFKYFAELLGAEVSEAEIVGKATGQLLTQARAAAGNGRGDESAPSEGATE